MNELFHNLTLITLGLMFGFNIGMYLTVGSKRWRIFTVLAIIALLCAILFSVLEEKL